MGNQLLEKRLNWVVRNSLCILAVDYCFIEFFPEERIMRKKLQGKNFSSSKSYLMESEEEAIRLDIKTDPEALRKQALWCGVKPGMRILDGGCGPGKTTALLHEMIQSDGHIIGVDFSEDRIEYAKEHYGGKKGLEFYRQDLRESMEKFGQFDLVWVRFVLEYYRVGALDIVKNLKDCLKPGGMLCLLDLDYNCLSHYELTPSMAAILPKLMNFVDEKYNFDTFVGRKLHSFLYDAGFEKIEVELTANNLLYGEKKLHLQFDWIKKVEIAARKAEKLINSYPGGYQKFVGDFKKYLDDPRSFSYAPLLIGKGFKPVLS
jgi:SAM-dependent methyltransferase